MGADYTGGVTSSDPGITHLRCADEDRELVAQLLNNAYADGRLDFEEHSERIAAAYNAKTFGDLDGLTTDLIPQPVARPTQIPAPASPGHAVAHHVSNAPVPADAFTGGRAILSNFRPSGPLVIPPYSEVTSILGDARIDLVDATFVSPETTIRVTAVLGEVRIRVPAGVRVVSSVSTVLGDFKAEGVVADDATVVLKLEGTSCLGDVKVLGPDTKLRKFQKFI